ncbi:MAG: UbiD family decarboxylase [Candidatus Bathyarchaeia archaeon]
MLRKFLEEVGAVYIDDEVDPDYGFAEYLTKTDIPVVFRRVRGYPGLKVVGNLCSSRRMISKAIKIPYEKLHEAWSDALEHPKSYEYTDSAEFMENVYEKPDLIKHLPFPIFYRGLGRRYATGTIVLARDPETGRMNASFHRLMLLEKNKLAIRIVPRDLYRFYTLNRKLGRDTKVAIVSGVHPTICMAAATSYPELNELQLARVFHEFQCINMDGLDVPAEAEIVMVGKILKDEEADEGPFVDLTGTIDAVRKQPILEVEKLYMKREPIWHLILPGGLEHKHLMGVPQEARMLKIIKNTVPTVKSVHLTSGGCCWLHAVVAIKKMHEGDGKNAGLAALAAHPSLKMVIVVDDDIDVESPNDVEWALATRLQPDKGVVIISGVRGSSLDPSQGKTGLTSKWIVDATIPLGADINSFRRLV